MSDTSTAPPAPAPTPPAPAPKRPSLIGRGQNDVGSISLPKIENETGAVVALLVVSMSWSVVREWLKNPSGGFSPVSNKQIVRILTGTWVVGLGVLIVHEFDPHLALLFAVLIVVGNIVSDNAGNKLVLGALDSVFSGV